MALNREGAAALAEGDLQTAEARIALALEYSPRFTEAWVNLGLVELSRGNFERAGRDFLRARDLNPDLPTPHHALGLLADREQRDLDAEAHYRAALKVDPGFAPARVNLARRLYARGATEEAREQFLRVTQVAPDFSDGWLGLCETLLRLDRTVEVERLLVDVLEHAGPSPTLLLIEARVLLHRGAFAEAASRLEVLAHAAAPSTSSLAFAWLAIARVGSGDRAGAAEAAARAVALSPSDPLAVYAMRASARVAGAVR